VVDVDVIFAFWDSRTWRILVTGSVTNSQKITKELLDITTQHASGEEVVCAAFILGNTGVVANGGRAVPTKAIVKGAKKGVKGGKKGQKKRPPHVAIAAGSDGGDEEAGDSGEECIVAVERSFRELLKVTCPHHSYPIKHKLKDCAMMKKFMMLGAFSKGSKL
jgi:hypothetical protein